MHSHSNQEGRSEDSQELHNDIRKYPHPTTRYEFISIEMARALQALQLKVFVRRSGLNWKCYSLCRQAMGQHLSYLCAKGELDLHRRVGHWLTDRVDCDEYWGDVTIEKEQYFDGTRLRTA